MKYFFSFFNRGVEALNVMRILVNAQPRGLVPPAHDDGEPSSGRTSLSGSHRHEADNMKHPKALDIVRATLSPVSPSAASPRASGEMTRSSFDALRPFGRRSLDVSRALRDDSPRRSFSDSRRSSRYHVPQKSPHFKQDSSDSYVQSIEEPSQPSFSALVASSSDDPQSASQILRDSQVFHRPTIGRRSVSATRHRDKSESTQAIHSKEHHGPQGLAAYKDRHAATTGHVADPGAGELDPYSPNTPTLKNLAKMGSYPLQRAGLYAGWLNEQGRKMSTLLATESMGYVEKVSGMWKGGRKHYDEPAGLRTEGDSEAEDDEKVAESMDRFRTHFALRESEKLLATYYAYISRVLPIYGKIYIGTRHFCFRSLLPGTRTKLVLPLKEIENVEKENGFHFGYSALVISIRRHEELFFEFGQQEARDDCVITLLQNADRARYLKESVLLGQEKIEADAAIAERDALQRARLGDHLDHGGKLQEDESPTVLFDDAKASILNFKPPQPLRITCLTIGSRGDVQPYIALAKALHAEGHKVRIATHAEFEPWIRGHGIDFALVEGDPAELMKICIENGTFTLKFLREANSKMRTWLDELLVSAWAACQEGTDLLIESPSTMAGIHIAEKLQIPYFRAFTMPWTRTRAYAHAFVMPDSKKGGAYNSFTYVMFDAVFWRATAGQINRWRNVTLGLPNTTWEKLQANKVPFLYNFSPQVVPPPLDFSDWIRVTGYWFLDEADHNNWTPPKELTDFIDQARADGKKLVYVGFGSILVPDPAKMTQEVIDAVLKADVRCILSKGWSDRWATPKDKERGAQLATEADPAGKAYDPDDSKTQTRSPVDPSKPEVPLPPEIFQIKSAPHDWLFKQIDAAAHHGGSGTTGASLRAGLPTIVRPFFGDQYFFGNRVEALGVGVCLRRWGSKSFARALWEVTHDERVIARARALGEEIRKVCLQRCLVPLTP
jgi:sterol 3beta-glucosyltransferase